MANMRISGIASGFDTDTMIKDLMKAESARVNKVKQNRQYVLWQQEGFREIINKLRTFQSNYFDVLKSNQNMTSPSSFAKFSYSVKSGGVDSTKVSVVAGADVKNKSVTIDSIDQLASKDKWTGNTSDLRGIKTGDLDIAALKTTLGAKDLEITVSVGSNAKLISVTQAELAAIGTVDALKTKLNEKITASFGSDYSNMVTVNGSKLEFDFAGTEIKVLKYGSNAESMTGLFGADASQSSYAYQSKTIGELFGLTNATLSSVVINGKNIALDETDTISKMLTKINGSEANVLMSYDSLRDRFTMESKSEGSANNITVTDGSNAETVLSKVFGNVANLVDGTGAVVNITRNEGVNAKLSINGTAVVQSNNTFSLDGMTYTLKETSVAAINIGVTTDTTSIIDNIKNFVKEYNDIVDFVNGKLSEKRDYDFDPLTDEEKEALSEEDIEKWETKAKAGNLRGSSELSSMLTELRNALIEPIEGAGLTMSQIGISSSSYTDKGKLTIDETKLKSALENNYEDVVTLFTKKSSVSYSDSANRATRDSENGIATRFEDILKDYTRTTRDSNGNKGKLIMKVGIENDASQFSNEFQKKITGYDDRISDLLEYLSDKEEYYYTMFSKMESALSQMESQSASLMSQLGSN